jgi:hypothetical protein
VVDCEGGVYCAQTVVSGGGLPAAGAPVRFWTPVATGWKSTSNPSEAYDPAGSVGNVHRRYPAAEPSVQVAAAPSIVPSCVPAKNVRPATSGTVICTLVMAVGPGLATVAVSAKRVAAPPGRGGFSPLSSTALAARTGSWGAVSTQPDVVQAE